MKNILITGCAGFIGYSLSNALLNDGYTIIGIDNLSDYYDINLKKNRLKLLKKYKKFSFQKLDISQNNFHKKIIINKKINLIINLAAQPGVRYSLINPQKYVETNITGFLNIILLSKKIRNKNIYYASSSSVYGDNRTLPYNEKSLVDKPLQFYAVTKVTNELMANMYSKLFEINFTGFRFFTVYGPYGRPDMSIYKFTENIYNSKKIFINGDGQHQRDFTHVDEIIDAMLKTLKKDYKNNFIQKKSRIFNIGKGEKIKINKIIKLIEENLNKKSKKVFLKPLEVDMKTTQASFKKLERYIGKIKKIDIETGIKQFVKWYLDYNK